MFLAACGLDDAIATEESQVLNSPGWPRSFLPNVQCSQVLRAASGIGYVTLKFQQFALFGRYSTLKVIFAKL